MLRLDIVSPLGQVISGVQTEKVVAQSLNGQITILQGHRDMVCLLGRGIVFAEGVEDKFVVYGGILETSGGEKVCIVADRITKISSIEEANVRSSIKGIEDKLNNNIIDDKEYKKTVEEYLDRVAELEAVLL